MSPARKSTPTPAPAPAAPAPLFEDAPERPAYTVAVPAEATQVVSYSYGNEKTVYVNWTAFASSAEQAKSFLRRAAAGWTPSDGTRVGVSIRDNKEDGRLIVTARAAQVRGPRKSKKDTSDSSK